MTLDCVNITWLFKFLSANSEKNGWLSYYSQWKFQCVFKTILAREVHFIIIDIVRSMYVIMDVQVSTSIVFYSCYGGCYRRCNHCTHQACLLFVSSSLRCMIIWAVTLSVFWCYWMMMFLQWKHIKKGGGDRIGFKSGIITLKNSSLYVYQKWILVRFWRFCKDYSNFQHGGRSSTGSNVISGWPLGQIYLGTS